MKCQILFSGKNKKNISDLLSAALAQSIIKVNKYSQTCLKKPPLNVAAEGRWLLNTVQIYVYEFLGNFPLAA